MLFRHGDVLVGKVKSLPKTAKKQRHLTLAEGELTGHSHRIDQSGSAVLYRDDSQLYLQVTKESATLVHDEHASIEIPKGTYRVWQQREYTPERIITVRD